MYLENMEAHNYNQFIIEQKIVIFLIFLVFLLCFFTFFAISKILSTNFFSNYYFSYAFFLYQCVLPCKNSVTTNDLEISDEKIQKRIFIYFI